jgi:hypothetical protein
VLGTSILHQNDPDSGPVTAENWIEEIRADSELNGATASLSGLEEVQEVIEGAERELVAAVPLRKPKSSQTVTLKSQAKISSSPIHMWVDSLLCMPCLH